MNNLEAPQRDHLPVGDARFVYYPVSQIPNTDHLPISLLILLENVLRTTSNPALARRYAQNIVESAQAGHPSLEIGFLPARVLLQDFTGVPVFVDFASMRDACKSLNADPETINPHIPCDLVIDHSVIADSFGTKDSLTCNQQMEFARNKERYTFLKWAQSSFRNVRIVPPGQGICHQINIEHFAHVVFSSTQDVPLVYFDTLVGTDSHTTTANGIGVLGWGVGGIEAEAAALGQPITICVPKVIGVEFIGSLRPEVSGFDVALKLAQVLRNKGVVGCFVECFGEGISSLSATQRSAIANMTPEYGCTATYFPIDEQTLDYLRLTGRTKEHLNLVESYARAQGVWAGSDISLKNRLYADTFTFDLSSIERSIAGPARPHDNIALTDAKDNISKICRDRGLEEHKCVSVEVQGKFYNLSHTSIALAAVTSCTTATDPAMMLTCGLLAKNAVCAGLNVKPWVKTILAPGSLATKMLLSRAGLLEPLCELGFYTCGFGCMSCIGNSGNLPDALHDIAHEIELASVLSGNRNFEGRISPDVSQNYLMSPPLVIAYALAGTMNIDLTSDPLGQKPDGTPLYLEDIWPDADEVQTLIRTYVTDDLYISAYSDLYSGSADWRSLKSQPSATFAWDDASTYVRSAPYFESLNTPTFVPPDISDARVLAYLGDFITTDHISPAGAIAHNSPAADYLKNHGVQQQYYNTYGARRGNHEIMMRGTFANVRLNNKLAHGRVGGWTTDPISGEVVPIYTAAMHARQNNIALIVLAGKMYGSGSSRDWAAKGPALLGVRAVLAQSFERIHRSNLIGMGVLPLQFLGGQSAESLGLTGDERFTLDGIDFSHGLPMPSVIGVRAQMPDGSKVAFEVQVRIDTATEGAYYAQGGILTYVLRQLTSS